MFDVELPGAFEDLDAAAADILGYEMARGLAHEAAHHRARINPVLLQRIETGKALPLSRYEKALACAAECRRGLADEMRNLDAIVTPSATGEAPLGLDSTGDTAMNRLWTLLHGPCITVPAGDGPNAMPLGIQLVALPRADAHLLAVARWVEQVFKA
jgi:Asp-tRNA(Asn)/Glu-tRNA(Gln) amidotransferase A subunit family amidase